MLPTLVVEQALLLGQKLTELRHPDHKLITYPGLGHTFYPVQRLGATIRTNSGVCVK